MNAPKKISAPIATSPSPIRLEGTRVLLVDDSPDNQRLFHRILMYAGAHVDIASNGQIAIDMERDGIYDLIIMDMHMPIVDGYQASQRIREHGYSGPIVALTAHATFGEEARCLAAGCSHFKAKPIDRNSLLRAVQSALAPQEI